MRKLLAAIFSLLFIVSCADHKNLSQQLHDNFGKHLNKIDPSASLDSVHILWNAPITQKLGRIIDDTIYLREFVRVQAQLASAKQKNDKDSIEFYQYEINYMQKPIDSVTQSIANGDTTRKFGRLIGVAYYITKNQKTKIDSTLVVIDSSSNMVYTDFMDSSIARTIKNLQ